MDHPKLAQRVKGEKGKVGLVFTQGEPLPLWKKGLG